MEELKNNIYRRTYSLFDDNNATSQKYEKLKSYSDNLGLYAIHYAILIDSEQYFKYFVNKFKQLNVLTQKQVTFYQSENYISQLKRKYENETKKLLSAQKEVMNTSQRLSTQKSVTNNTQYFPEQNVFNDQIICQGMKCKQYKLSQYSTIIMFACVCNSQKILRFIIDQINQGKKDYISLVGQQNSQGLNALQICLLTGNFRLQIKQTGYDQDTYDQEYVTNNIVLRKELCQITEDNMSTLMIAAFCKRVLYIVFIMQLYKSLFDQQLILSKGNIYSQNFTYYVQQMILKQDNGFDFRVAASDKLSENSKYILGLDRNLTNRECIEYSDRLYKLATSQ